MSLYKAKSNFFSRLRRFLQYKFALLPSDRMLNKFNWRIKLSFLGPRCYTKLGLKTIKSTVFTLAFTTRKFLTVKEALPLILTAFWYTFNCLWWENWSRLTSWPRPRSWSGRTSCSFPNNGLIIYDDDVKFHEFWRFCIIEANSTLLAEEFTSWGSFKLNLILTFCCLPALAATLLVKILINDCDQFCVCRVLYIGLGSRITGCHPSKFWIFLNPVENQRIEFLEYFSKL